MSEKTKVWIRTSVLDTIIFGKSKTCTSRSIPGAGGGASAGFDENATYYSAFTVNSTFSTTSNATTANDGDQLKNWGWSRGYIVNENGKGGAADKINEEMVKIYITDQDSAHCNTEISIPFQGAFSKGDLVMDNSYGDHHPSCYFDDSDDEDEEGDDYGYGGGNDYGYGGGDNNTTSVRGNPEDKYPNDLIILTHLHEASVVYCLRKRYSYDKIYTSTGPILIALNPFKNCKALYSEAMMKKYWNRGEKEMLMNGNSGIGSKDKKSGSLQGDNGDNDEELLPHVYATADRSFRIMMTKLEENKQSGGSEGGGGGRGRRTAPGKSKSNTNTGSCNQSILVSGESGAGKTVTTKFIMQYLATLSKRSATESNGTSSGRRQSITASGGKTDIEQQVLQSNPILESFGNARTIRNDNSSRFGKFIEIQFTGTGNLVGANIETYLLEKVRLVSQANGERNYHIFYEILQGMDDDNLDKYYLADYTAEDFKMTNQSDTYDRRDGVSDYDTYQDLLHAMETMGFAVTEQADILSVTCAMLHASNLNFNSINADDESEIDKSNVHLEYMLSLLGLSADALNRALCYFSITAGREKHTRSNSKEKAEKGLLALIKATYGALFTYVVKRVNESITLEDESSRGGGRRGKDGGNKAAASIGVLDIFGFESFKKNSFEQLCINFCNETLQQQFNMFVLKNEQDEYEKEGIQWSFISFPDNQDALDLIAKKGTGILSILDDQARAPGATDKTFINDVYQKFSRHSRFQANRRQVGSRKFAIVHYAGTVEYGSKGFVDKNRDDLPKEATELLLSSSNAFVKTLAEIINGPSSAGSAPPKGRMTSKNSKLTVGGQFSRQLQELRMKIDNTSPHYVRCLKPNDELVPDHFDPLIVADQLRCAGVIEAVRVSRVGYPQRYIHARFMARYHILGQSALKKAARSSRRQKPVDVLVRAIAEQVSQHKSDEKKPSGETVDLVSVGIQVGKTKVFLRREAYETLELLRNRQMRSGAIKIQSLGRCYIQKKEYNGSKNAVIKLQSFIRGNIARKIVHEMRRNHNATKIQCAYKRAVAHRTFVAMKTCSQWLQRMHRGNIGRTRYRILNRQRKAVILQKYWRMFYLSKLLKSKKTSALTLQCAWRCAQSRKELKALKMAARDLNNTAQERDKLREENRKLTKALADALGRGSKAESCANSFEDQKKDLLTQIQQLKESCTEKDRQMDDQKVDMNQIKDELKTTLDKIDENNRNYENKLADALNKVTSAEKKVKDLETEREDSLSRITQLEESCIMKDKEKDDQRLEFEKLTDELNKSVEQMVGNKENEGVELTDALNRADQAQIDAEKLKTERNELLTKIHELEESCALKDKKISDQNLEMEKLNASPTGETSESEAITENLKELSSQIQKLKETCALKDKKISEQTVDIEKLEGELKSQSKRMNRFQTLESKASREMGKLIDDCSQQSDRSSTSSRAESPMFSLAADSDEEKEKDTHIANLEKEIVDLKEEISDLQKQLNDAKKTTSTTKKSSSLQKEVDKLKKKLSETKKNAAEEILTLQDEVGRLNKEVSHVKATRDEDAISDIGSSPSNESNQADKLADALKDGRQSPDEQMSLMVHSLMVKDAEIRQLRQEVASLKDQLDETTMSMLSDSRFNDDMDDRSVMSKIFGAPQSRSGGRSVSGSTMRSGFEQDKLALRKANRELKRELEEVKDELEECKYELEQEKLNSGKEIKAFGDALKGVDELRTAAEEMNREIIRLKQRDDDEVPEDPFETVGSDEADDKLTEEVKLNRARRLVSNASKSGQSSIWSKMRLSVRSLNEEVIPEDEDYKGSKPQKRFRRLNSDDGSKDGSVFSSFF